MIHETAEVQTQKIGAGTIIRQNCVILKGAQIGKNCNINFNVFIENDVVIGDDVTIKPGVQIWDGLRVKNKVFIGPNVTFTNDLLPRSKRYPEKFEKTILEKGCSIGANATILAGIIVGEYALIGAGSVVTKNIPPYTVWYGNPAIHKGFITTEGVLLNTSLQSRDGKKYILKNQIPVIK